MNDEKLEYEREFDAIIALLKEAERRALLNGEFCEIRKIMVIHMAVLKAYDDMTEALEFIKAIYSKEDDES